MTEGPLGSPDPDAWTIDHDVPFMEPVFGDSVKIGRFLLYGSGRVGHLCGWPLTGSPGVTAGEASQLSRSATGIGLDTLHTWGPIPLELPGWRLEYVSPPQAHDYLMRIDLPALDHSALRRQRNHQRARNSPLQLEVSQGFPQDVALDPLVSPYTANTRIPLVQRRLIRLARRRELSRDCDVFLAGDGGTVAGAMVCSRLPNGTVVARWTLTPSTGVSDFVYLHLLAFYQELGLSVIDLGYGATASLFDYKRRWGANDLRGPVWRVGLRTETSAG